MIGTPIASIHTAGPILSADVDWARKRIAAVVDGVAGVPIFEFGNGALRPLRDLGATMMPPDGEAATDVILHATEDVALSVGWDRGVRVWSLPSGDLVREFGEVNAETSNRRGFHTASLSMCGRYLDTRNLALCRIQRFDWRTGALLASRWGESGPVVRHPRADLLALSIGADASIAYFAGCDGADTVWAPVAITMWICCGFAFASGALAAVGGSTAVHAMVYDFPQLTPRFSLIYDAIDEDTAGEFGVSQALAWAPDGRTLYIPGGDGEIVAIDANSGRVQSRWRGHDGMVTKLIHHPTEGRLLSTGLDGRIVIHQTRAGTRAESGPDVEAFFTRFPPLRMDPEEAGDERVTYLDAPRYARVSDLGRVRPEE